MERYEKLNDSLRYWGLENNVAIHTEPLIRRESPYNEYAPNERRAIFHIISNYSNWY